MKQTKKGDGRRILQRKDEEKGVYQQKLGRILVIQPRTEEKRTGKWLGYLGAVSSRVAESRLPLRAISMSISTFNVHNQFK